MNIFDYVLDPAHWQGPNSIGRLLLEHLGYTAAAVAIAAVIAIPLGVLIGHTGQGSLLVTGVSNAARALPSLGLLVLAVLLFQTGVLPIIGVLALLALPTILTATATGVHGADREAVFAARALGMSAGQIVRKVEWPLAVPLLIGGLRRATLQVVATTTIVAFAGGGALGRLLISGNAAGSYPEMFAGALIVALLAVTLYLLLGGIGWFAGRKARPRSQAAPAAVAIPT